MISNLTKQISPAFSNILSAPPKQYIRKDVQEVVGGEELSARLQ
jgi:hypothetical protein